MKCLKCLGEVTQRHAKRDDKWQDIHECENCKEVGIMGIYFSGNNLKVLCGIPNRDDVQKNDKIFWQKFGINITKVMAESGVALDEKGYILLDGKLMSPEIFNSMTKSLKTELITKTLTKGNV